MGQIVGKYLVEEGEIGLELHPLGLAQFSGAILRRPNVNIYLALVLALIAYQTRTGEAEKGGSACS